MTRAERTRRNHGIIAAYCAGTPSREIGERFCVTPRYVHTIAARAGLSKPRGRPVALPHASDQQLDEYRRLRRHYGAEMAREMVGVG